MAKKSPRGRAEGVLLCLGDSKNIRIIFKYCLFAECLLGVTGGKVVLWDVIFNSNFFGFFKYRFFLNAGGIVTLCSITIIANNDKTNLEVVQTICRILNELAPIENSKLNIPSYESLITFVKDRPGHDRRYAIDARKIANELNWQPNETFESGIRKTVQWYLDNQGWCQRVQNGSYQRERLGVTS